MMMMMMEMNTLYCIFTNFVSIHIIRKRWIFYPPDQKQYLYPTRVPYEESSVFSKVSINHPDLKMFPLFQVCNLFIVEFVHCSQ